MGAVRPLLVFIILAVYGVAGLRMCKSFVAPPPPEPTKAEVEELVLEALRLCKAEGKCQGIAAPK